MKLGRNTRRRIVFYGLLAGAITGGALFCSLMPGRSFRGPAPPLDYREARYATRAQAHVSALAGTIGERNTQHPAKLHAAADYIESELRGAGYDVERHGYVVDDVACDTLDAMLVGRSTEVVLVGAHYDSAESAPGADDNGSGAAGVLALARTLAGQSLKRTVRFALFANEEPPYFATPSMGSLVYARDLEARGENIVAMLSLESIGYFSDAPGSQRYPSIVSLLYPDRGDFVAFVGDVGSRALVRDAIRVFRRGATIASEGAALPAAIPGVDWSDQRSFRAFGVPAIMVTDTAIFRNPNYHRATDAVITVDYARLGRVMAGVEDVVRELAGR